jgi:hypothetical protein
VYKLVDDRIEFTEGGMPVNVDEAVVAQAVECLRPTFHRFPRKITCSLVIPGCRCS